VLIAVLPLLALLLYTATTQRQVAANEALEQGRQIVQLAATGQARLLEGARQMLMVLAQMPAVREGGPEAHERLANLIFQPPYCVDLVLASPDGGVMKAGLGTGKVVNVRGSTAFAEAVKRERFAVGAYRMDEISGASLDVAYPVTDGDGQTRAVLCAWLDLHALARELSWVQAPSKARLAVTDTQGNVLAALPSAPSAIGRPAVELPLLRPGLMGRTAGAFRATGADGVDRFHAYAPVSIASSGPVLWVSYRQRAEVVFEEVNHQLYIHLLGLALVTLLALAAAWFGGDLFLIGRARAIVAAARRLKDGELGARTGLPRRSDELGELAQVFDELSAALQQRDTERRRAADALRRSRDGLEEIVRERATELARERDLLCSIVDGLPDFVYVKDRDSRYVVDNASHRSLLGAHSPNDVTGRNAHDFFPPELAQRYEADDRTVIETGMPLFNHEEEVVDHHGTRLWIATTKVPLRDSKGNIIGLVGVGRDITDRKPPS